MKRLIVGAVLAVTLVPAVTMAEAGAPALSPEDIAGLQTGDGEPTPENLVAILDPAASGTTRALQPGGDPAPGTAGSGVIPDLQIRFATASAQISKDARQRLGALGIALRFPQLEDRRFVIAGHTDARGSDQANLLLSQRRAEAVVRFLIEGYSIAPERLTAIGYGETRLADPTNPASGTNRRVEVRLD